MSVWPLSSSAGLTSEEGDLLMVSIAVEPRRLESLLETLAQLPFPVNPEIYHGHEAQGAATLVEFPAYEIHLSDVRCALDGAGFDAGSVSATNMLAEIQSTGRIRRRGAGSSL